MAKTRLAVTFHKCHERSPHSWWDGRRDTGGRVKGGPMPTGRGVIPHDLVHLATEAGLGLEFGFWGLVARGATFRRGTDRRRTRPGRALVAAHRSDLRQAEALGNAHHQAWLDGRPTPMGPTFDRLARLWQDLPDGGILRVDWPTLAVRPEAANEDRASRAG